MPNSNQPIFTIGHYQFIHRSNDSLVRFAKAEQETPLLFWLLRAFVAWKIVMACFIILAQLATWFHISAFFVFTILIIFLLAMMIGSYAFFASFQIINTKNPQQPQRPTTINKLEWIWVGVLAVLALLDIAQKHFSHHLTFGNTIHLLLILIGIPYLIYRLHTLLFK